MFSAQCCSQDACHLHIPRSSGREERSPVRRDREVGDEAEMVAGPHTVDRFVEDTRASRNVQCRSSVLPTTHKDVVDSSERPVPIPQQRIARSVSMAGISRMRSLPGVTVADAHFTQRLAASQEAYTGTSPRRGPMVGNWLV